MTSRAYAPNRIRELRKEAGLTMEALAARIDPEPATATISKLEKGTMGLTLDWIQAIAEALGVSPAAVIGEADGAPTYREVPVIGSIAAGNWREAILDPQGSVPAPHDVGGPNVVGLRVEGDSMDLLAPEGSVVTMDPDDRDLHERRVYAVQNADGGTTFKRFFYSPARLEPCSTNPEHKPIMLGGEPVTVLGRITSMSMAL